MHRRLAVALILALVCAVVPASLVSARGQPDVPGSHGHARAAAATQAALPMNAEDGPVVAAGKPSSVGPKAGQ